MASAHGNIPDIYYTCRESRILFIAHSSFFIAHSSLLITKVTYLT